MNRLWFCCGTAGELIKIYPLIRMAEERGMPWLMVSTGQSGVNFFKQWDDFKLPRDRVKTLVDTEKDLKTSHQALRWFIRAILLFRSKLIARLTDLFGSSPDSRDFWIVHGDTLSTLVGSRYAKRLNVPLVHIEAGLRSAHLLKPFPEEINRRLVSRVAKFHFTQDERATENLKKAAVDGQIICTGGNTLIDAIQYVSRDSRDSDSPKRPFIVANLHRFENLHSAKNWALMVDVLIRAAKIHPVLLVQHPPTEEKLRNESETRAKLLAAGVQLLPRQPFTRFIQILSDSEFVISDGGSNQEECFYMGKPCLLLRDFTERVEGLDGPCVLTRFQPELIDRFLSQPDSYRSDPVRFHKAPTAVVLDRLGAAT